MKEIWLKKSESFKDAETFDKYYYLSMSPSQRIETMQLLREMRLKMKRKSKNEDRKRLRRIIKVIQQKQG